MHDLLNHLIYLVNYFNYLLNYFLIPHLKFWLEIFSSCNKWTSSNLKKGRVKWFTLNNANDQYDLFFVHIINRLYVIDGKSIPRLEEISINLWCLIFHRNISFEMKQWIRFTLMCHMIIDVSLTSSKQPLLFNLSRGHMWRSLMNY